MNKIINDKYFTMKKFIIKNACSKDFAKYSLHTIHLDYIIENKVIKEINENELYLYYRLKIPFM
jgi:hypothetical protein